MTATVAAAEREPLEAEAGRCWTQWLNAYTREADATYSEGRREAAYTYAEELRAAFYAGFTAGRSSSDE